MEHLDTDWRVVVIGGAGLDIKGRLLEPLIEKTSNPGRLTISAVSYTHLDVYKRQVLKQCNIGQLQVGILESALRKQVFDPFLGLAGIDAVADSLRRGGWLAFEAVDQSLYCSRLIGLHFELKLHHLTTCDL